MLGGDFLKIRDSYLIKKILLDNSKTINRMKNNSQSSLCFTDFLLSS